MGCARNTTRPFPDAHREVQIDRLPVWTAELAATWLAGSLIRTGPARFEATGAQPSPNCFDGQAMPPSLQLRPTFNDKRKKKMASPLPANRELATPAERKRCGRSGRLPRVRHPTHAVDLSAGWVTMFLSEAERTTRT